MKTSPVKFDDLAFILLFFFLMVAVISFSKTDEVSVSSQSEKSEENNISVFLDENGNLSQTGFQENDCIDLHCSPLANWKTIQNAIRYISRQEANVTLVIE